MMDAQKLHQKAIFNKLSVTGRRSRQVNDISHLFFKHAGSSPAASTTILQPILIRSLHSVCGIAYNAGAQLDSLYLYASDPVIALGLVIGEILPYLVTAILTIITKWSLFVAIRRCHPNILTLLVVAIAESFCIFVATMSMKLLDIPVFVAFAAYAVLAIFPNLLLIPSVNQGGGDLVLTKCLYAFFLGLIYPLWGLLVAIGLSALLDRFLWDVSP